MSDRSEMKLKKKVLDCLNNQPNGIVIGYSREDVEKPIMSSFDHLSRAQQVAQLILMLQCGVDFIDLKTDLHCVSHLDLQSVWAAFGVPTFLVTDELLNSTE